MKNAKNILFLGKEPFLEKNYLTKSVHNWKIKNWKKNFPGIPDPDFYPDSTFSGFFASMACRNHLCQRFFELYQMLHLWGDIYFITSPVCSVPNKLYVLIFFFFAFIGPIVYFFLHSFMILNRNTRTNMCKSLNIVFICQYLMDIWIFFLIYKSFSASHWISAIKERIILDCK